MVFWMFIFKLFKVVFRLGSLEYVMFVKLFCWVVIWKFMFFFFFDLGYCIVKEVVVKVVMLD